MNGELYRAVIVPANKAPDGESPSTVHATQESNGYAVWFSGHDEGTVCIALRRIWTRDLVIEYAVDFARNLKANKAEAWNIVNGASAA